MHYGRILKNPPTLNKQENKTMTQAEQTERNIELCCAIIDCAYMLHLPNAYPHDVAHTCIEVMQHEDVRRFVIGYRDSGVEYLDSGGKLDRLRKVFGPMQLYVFLPNDDPQSSKWTPYKAIPVDEISASRHLLGLSLSPNTETVARSTRQFTHPDRETWTDHVTNPTGDWIYIYWCHDLQQWREGLPD